MKNPNAQALGKLGGEKTVEKFGADFMREISKKGVAERLRRKNERRKNENSNNR